MKNPLLIWLQRALASMLFIGYIPLISGTLGSAATIGLIWWICIYKHILLTPLVMWGAGLFIIAFSILVSARPREVFGNDDPKQVVIDECAGQFITFLFVPLSLKVLVLGFFLFRFFDIVKPYPIFKFEALDDSLGITMDDVAAGVFANITLMLILWGYHAVRAWL